jgi:undecaprenyl pyrophosphate phosphatase UppP
MSGPIVLASSFYLFLENPNLVIQSWPALIASFLFGILSLKILISWAKKIDFFKFALFFSLTCFLGAILGFIL